MFTDFDQIAVSSSVLSIADLTPPTQYHHVHIQSTDGVIRYTMDGSTPSSSLGLRLINGKLPKSFLAEDFKQIKFVRETGDAVLLVHYTVGREVINQIMWVWQDGSYHMWQDGEQADFIE